MEVKMKRVYVAHPFHGDHPDDIARIYANVYAVERICQSLAKSEPDVNIFSPIHAYNFLPWLGDQAQALKMCRDSLSRCDELRVFGDWENSQGCLLEIEWARELGLSIIYEDGPVEGGRE